MTYKKSNAKKKVDRQKSMKKSRINAASQGYYWDSDVKDPELNTSDSLRVRKKRIKNIKKHHNKEIRKIKRKYIKDKINVAFRRKNYREGK